MHELSIAMSILDMAGEEAERLGGARVLGIHLKLGPLSGVVKEALLSAFCLAREADTLHEAQLVIEEVPIVLYCPTCQREQAAVSIQELCCVECGSQRKSGERSGARGCRPGNPMTAQTRLVQVRQNVLKQNDVAARALRQRFHQAGLLGISLVSSPGTGKTALLEKMLTSLRAHYRVAALVGDLATYNDAQRLARSQVPVRQIITGTVCHLEAQMVQEALEGWILADLDFLFIENVGNLVCPSSYDLGEDVRLVLLSVTEGEDKPLKYPTIFNTADVAIITKIDLAEVVEFDRALAHQNIHSVRPGMRVFELSAKSGAGMDEWLGFLETCLLELRETHCR